MTTGGNEFDGKGPHGDGLVQRIVRSKSFLGVGGGLLVVLLGIQFVAAEGVGENPDERFEIDAPPDVKQILVESCYDCHSNEVRWPWYSRVAPMSWLVAQDVKEGRESLNFSTWGSKSKEDIEFEKEAAWDEIEEGEMPLWFYIPLHPEAALTDEEKAKLKAWLLAHQDEDDEDDEEAGEAAGQDEQAKANADGSGAGGAQGESAEEQVDDADSEKKND